MNLPDDTFNELERNINNALSTVNIGMWDYDLLNDRGFWSDYTYEIFGIDKSQIPSFQTVFNLIHPQDRVNFLYVYNEAIRTQKGYRAKYRIIRKDGSMRHLISYSDMQLDENRQVVRIIGTTVDVTEQDFFNRQLIQRINEISGNLDIGIWSKDVVNSKIKFCSVGIESICGYTAKEMEQGAVSWGDIVYPKDKKNYQTNQEKLQLNQKVKHQYRIIHKNGQIKWVQDETIPVFDMNGTLFRLDGIVTDLTAQKKVEEKITYLLNHDYLTNLPNKRMFDDQLYSLIETLKAEQSDEQFVIMFLDLDGFKRINDIFGRPTGDKLLKLVSSQLQLCISDPEHDTVARMGGDEFSFIIRNVSSTEQLIEMVNRILAIFEEPFFIDELELFITTSIGLAYFNKSTDDSTVLFKKVDIALQNAKFTGKSNFRIYDESMEKEYLKSYNVERDLRKAIKKEEFLLYYQPKVDTKTGKIVGAEALIRWQHYQKGMIAPGEFIPIAEESAFIFDITDWTFRKACEQLKIWEQMGLPLVPVSVNISPRCFLKSTLVENFLKIIQETGVNPEMLELEITETAIIDNAQVFEDCLKELKKYGIRISLDDFGTGYSSLLYLNKFMIDTVKIDQQFIKCYMTDNNSPVAKYTINLAHELNLNVVAEGVETKAQLDFLSHHNCDQIQGYLFSKPVPAEEFSELLKKKYL